MPAVFIGIDDTDTLDSPGTNQLARRITHTLPAGSQATLILRHQLFFDPRVPFTSQNGSASITVEARASLDPRTLLPGLRREMAAWFVAGSDPGLCVAGEVPEPVIAFARRCQRELVSQTEARRLAAEAGIHLEGLGGTEDGVIGALAAVGLLASGADGRVIHRPGWSWPDGFAGVQPVAAILARGVDEVRDARADAPVEEGMVDVGKHLRPAFRAGRVVLLVERVNGDSLLEPDWRAVRLP